MERSVSVKEEDMAEEGEVPIEEQITELEGCIKSVKRAKQGIKAKAQIEVRDADLKQLNGRLNKIKFVQE